MWDGREILLSPCTADDSVTKTPTIYKQTTGRNCCWMCSTCPACGLSAKTNKWLQVLFSYFAVVTAECFTTVALADPDSQREFWPHWSGVKGWECWENVKQKCCLLNGNMTQCSTFTEHLFQQWQLCTLTVDCNSTHLPHTPPSEWPCCVVWGLKNGFQGHVTSKFKSQGSHIPSLTCPSLMLRTKLTFSQWCGGWGAAKETL